MKLVRKLWITTIFWWNNSLVERGDMFLYGFNLFFTPLVIMLIWLVINSAGNNTTLTYNEIGLYFLATTLVKSITSSWMGQFMPGRIKRGAISPYLLRPVPFFVDWIGNNIAEKVLRLTFLIPAVGLTAWGLGIAFPQSLSWGTVLLVLTSTILAAVLYFSIDIAVGMLAFWLEETRAIQEMTLAVDSFFSGRLIPIFMLPMVLQSVSKYLPYRYTLSLPIEIFLGKLSEFQIMVGVVIQISYVFLFVGLSRLLWKKGLIKYSAAGV